MAAEEDNKLARGHFRSERFVLYLFRSNSEDLATARVKRGAFSHLDASFSHLDASFPHLHCLNLREVVGAGC